jgi:hypothetical protein
MNDPDTVSLKEFIDHRFDAMQIQMNLRFEALDKALLLAAKTADEKYLSLNKVKEDVAKDKEKYQTKELCGLEMKALHIWKQEVNTFMTRMNTRLITWTTAIGVFYVILTLVLRWYGK